MVRMKRQANHQSGARAARARRHETYLVTTRGIFLKGLPFNSPAEAVNAGARTIHEWCDVLTIELDKLSSETPVNTGRQPGSSKKVVISPRATLES